MQIFDLSLESFLSLVWFVDELDRDGGFPLLFLMFSAFSCSIVVLCWIVVIFVLLDFLSMLVLLRLRFNYQNTKFFLFSLAANLLVIFSLAANLLVIFSLAANLLVLFELLFD